METYDLSAEDYAALLALLPDIYLLRDLGDLAEVMLRITSLLIPNLMCTYNEMNFRNGNVIAAYHPASMRGPMEALMPELSTSVDQHPIYQKAFNTGEGHPQFLSDYLSEEEAALNPFSKLAMERLNVHDHLIFSLQNSHQSWIFIAVSRSKRDFTERERAIATLLRTHFSAAYDNATAFTEARAKALVLDRAIDTAAHGIVMLDDQGRVLHMNNAVQVLLERYFPQRHGWKAELPTPITAWLAGRDESGLTPTEPYVITHGSSRLIVRASNMEGRRRIMLFRESAVQNGPLLLRKLGLSQRQAEVLYWTSEGKSNSEIGIILSISTRTVEKHLQMVYTKLHVETRTGAMLSAHRILSDAA